MNTEIFKLLYFCPQVPACFERKLRDSWGHAIAADRKLRQAVKANNQYLILLKNPYKNISLLDIVT